MTFTVLGRDGGTVRARIQGDLDGFTVWDARLEIATLLSMRPLHVEMDLSLVQLMDSCGVGLLVSFHKRLREQGGELSLVGLHDQPLSIVRLLHLDGLIASEPPSA